MKKFLCLWAERKRRQENFYNLYDASLPDNKDNHLSQKDIFKYYPFDSEKLSHGVLVDSRFEDTSNSRECLSQPLSNLHSITPTQTDLFDLQQKRELHVIKNVLDSDGSVIEMEQKEAKCQPEKKSTGKNMYLININNSKCFHIGSQKTFNVSEKPLRRETVLQHEVQPFESPFENYFPYLKIDFLSLLDSEERLTEEHILLISQHVNDRWKEFFKYLGLSESNLEVLESRNKSNRILSVYDALHEYMTLFPNTSLGFVINALSEIHQVIAVEKLVQEIKN